MTETEWAESGAPTRMFDQVGGTALGRKQRLLGCGLGRHVWPALRDPRSRTAIEVAELYADGAASATELSAAEDGAREAMRKARRYQRNRSRYECFGTSIPVWAAGTDVGGWGVGDGRGEELPGGPPVDTALWEDAAEAMAAGGLWHAELRWLCGAVRCVFGNPFRPAAFRPTWRTPAVKAAARRMYDARDFAATPALADALEAAGCRDADVLTHLRGPGPHVRGCWVIDLILGRE